MHRYLRCVDDSLSVESLLVDSLFSLYVRNSNVELAQCRQLYRVVTVDSKISHPSAAIPSPNVGEVLVYPDLWIVE